MIYAYIDESGDLGTHRRSSKNFILVALVTSEPRKVEKMINRFRHRALKTKDSRGELHAYHTDQHTKIGLLKALASMETIAIYAIVFKKRKQIARQKVKSTDADTLMVRLLAIVSHEGHMDVVRADTHSTKTQREATEEKVSHAFSVNFSFADSHAVKPIQAADFIAWALFQKYERGDNTFFDIISTRIKKIVVI